MTTLYSDPLVTITDEAIEFHGYSFLTRDKRVPWADVHTVRALTPKLFNGKWRLWGWGGGDIWIPSDFDRPKRQTIFHMMLHSPSMNIRFIVPAATRVKEILP